MKQWITIENLNELSDEQKEKLRLWWKMRNPGRFDLYVVKVTYDGVARYKGPIVHSDDRDFEEDFYQGEALPLFSIGQMMEFVGDNLENGFCVDYNSEKISHYFHWVIPRSMLPDSRQGEPPSHSDVCDALWFATKTVLASVE